VIHLVWLSLLSQSYYTPQEAQEIFSRAGEAYYREGYAAAKQEYLKLLSHGFGGSDVLYNLGTACLNHGELGDAVLYLERARRLEGNSSDIEANLTIAKSRQLDQVLGSSEDPFVERLANAIRERAIGIAFVAAWGFGFLTLSLSRFFSRGPRLLGRTIATAFFILALANGGLLLIPPSVRRTHTDGVVTAKTVQAREFPQDAGKVSFEIHSGLKVRVLESSGKYLRLRLPNGLEGWAQAEGISII